MLQDYKGFLNILIKFQGIYSGELRDFEDLKRTTNISSCFQGIQEIFQSFNDLEGFKKI